MIMLNLKNRISHIYTIRIEDKKKKNVDTSQKTLPKPYQLNIHIVYITEFYFYS